MYIMYFVSTLLKNIILYSNILQEEESVDSEKCENDDDESAGESEETRRLMPIGTSCYIDHIRQGVRHARPAHREPTIREASATRSSLFRHIEVIASRNSVPSRCNFASF
jgi:hypothetical protein